MRRSTALPRLELPSPTGPLTQMLSFVHSPEPGMNKTAALKTALSSGSTRLMLAAYKAVQPVARIMTPHFKTQSAKGMAQAADTQALHYLRHAANYVRLTNTARARPQPNEYTACWAETAEDLRAAQALRWQVFAQELKATLHSTVRGLDIDPFDQHCHHLLVKDASGRVVGTYRALLPEQVALICTWYSSSEFYLKPLLPHAQRVMEVGRSCVHADHRNGTVMMMLWQELARFMDAHKLDWLFGCASVPTRADNGRMAARIWQHAVDKQMLDNEVFCKPKLPLDIEQHIQTSMNDELVIPPLLKGYMRLGAKIAGAPAVDHAFGCADFLILLRKENITPRYARHFFGPAAAAHS